MARPVRENRAVESFTVASLPAALLQDSRAPAADSDRSPKRVCNGFPLPNSGLIPPERCPDWLPRSRHLAAFAKPCEIVGPRLAYPRVVPERCPDCSAHQSSRGAILAHLTECAPLAVGERRGAQSIVGDRIVRAQAQRSFILFDRFL